VPSNDITQEVPVVQPTYRPLKRKFGQRRSSESEVTLTFAWKIPDHSILSLNHGTPQEEWVRVTNTVGNGPYQVTVTKFTTRGAWYWKLRYRLSALVSTWKHRVWWPVVDKAEDAWHWLKEH
jgi:hypothetical protein